MDHIREEVTIAEPELYQQPTPPPIDSLIPAGAESRIADEQDIKRMDIEEESVAGPDMLSPMSADVDNKAEESELPALASTDLGSPSMGYDFSNIRVRAFVLHSTQH